MPEIVSASRRGGSLRNSVPADLPRSVTLLSDALRLPVNPSQSPHLLLVVDEFPRALGGGERAVLRIAEMLQESEFRVSILTFAVDPECTALDAAPCPVYLQPLTGVFRPSVLPDALELGRFLRRENVSIVETFFESSNLYAGIVTKLLSKASLVWSFRDMGILRSRKHRLAYRLLPWLPDRVFAVSDEVRQHAIAVDRIPENRVDVIYNGIDLERWPARSSRATASLAENAPMTVVTLGNLRQIKGQDVLLEAAAEVMKVFPTVRFEVAGDVLEPEYFARLEQRAQELGIENRFVFLGGVTDLPVLFSRADVFVLPSRSEGFSNAIIEAMAASLPVVATAVGGNAEAVLDGESGLIVPPDDACALAKAIVRILSEPDRGAQMGIAGRQRLETLFSASEIKSRIINIFRGVLEK
jgi:glycosyltransferase involved in cell wall biosynthesis